MAQSRAAGAGHNRCCQLPLAGLQSAGLADGSQPYDGHFLRWLCDSCHQYVVPDEGATRPERLASGAYQSARWCRYFGLHSLPRVWRGAAYAGSCTEPCAVGYTAGDRCFDYHLSTGEGATETICWSSQAQRRRGGCRVKTALVTLGRLPKGLDICRALNEAGWRVIVAEPSERHLCGLSNSVARTLPATAPNDDADAYLNDTLDIIRGEGVQLVVPVSEEIIHASKLKRHMPNGVRFFGMDHDDLLLLHDKFAFSKSAAAIGLAVPETAMLGSPEADEMVSQYRVIVKPLYTCSGQGLRFIERGDALPAKTSQPMLVQRALPGRHSSSFSVCHEGRVIGTVIYRPEILSDTVSVAFRQDRHAGAERQWVEQFVAAQNLSGFQSFDFIEDEAGESCAIECNPRATSGIHFVTAESLAAAITDPANCRSLEFRNEPVMYQLWPTLTETQKSMFRWGAGYGHKMTTLLGAKEANFSWRDPMPVWGQPWAAWQIMRDAMGNGVSFGEAATQDIAWFGDPPSVG
ncbi:ATP-grasp domain superfamily [Ahrensia sp. R2A130]|nr:ATP-grasp domain superfamily [Ahrensia sp. R2A130]